MSLRSAEVIKITEILRKVCKPMIRDFHEIQKLQGSKNVVEFFQKLYKKTESSLLRELSLYKAASGLDCTIIAFPIDGKKNFLRGISHFTTSVLLKKDDKPLICVIEAPMLSTTFWAERDYGAFLEDLSGIERLRVNTCSDVDRSLTLLSSTKIHPGLADCRMLGAITLDACYIATGRADCLVVDTKSVGRNLVLLTGLLVEESNGSVLESGEDFIFSNFDLAPKIKNCIEEGQDGQPQS